MVNGEATKLGEDREQGAEKTVGARAGGVSPDIRRGLSRKRPRAESEEEGASAPRSQKEQQQQPTPVGREARHARTDHLYEGNQGGQADHACGSSAGLGFIERDVDPSLVAGFKKIPGGTTDFRVRPVNAAWPKLVFDADAFTGAPGSVEARTFLKSYTFGQSATYSVKLYGLLEAKTMAYIWCEKVQYAFNIFWTDGRTHLDNARLASWTPLPGWMQLLESYHLADNERAYRRLDSLLRPGERRT